MSEHTPGPWTCGNRNWRGMPTTRDIYVSGDPFETCDDETGEQDGTAATSVAIVVGDRAVPAVRANARLIAAAPTMYAYIAAKAKDGDAEAANILEGIK